MPYNIYHFESPRINGFLIARKFTQRRKPPQTLRTADFGCREMCDSGFDEIEIVPNAGNNPTDASSKSAQLRRLRCSSKLTDETFATLFVEKKESSFLSGKTDFRVPNAVVVLRGALSQFDGASHGSAQLLPSIANDCCQTFSAVCAALLCSCGCVKNLTDMWVPSTVNYILYVSAWLHQLTSPVWRESGKVRPNVRDLNKLLKLKTTFPAAPDDDFEILFYNEAEKIVNKIESLCTSRSKRKRERMSDASTPATCGFLIVSGDYTISVLCVPHDTTIENNPAYALILCDSHGTTPWSRNKASLLLLTIIDNLPDGESADMPNGSKAYNISTGSKYFCEILFAILEDNRKEAWKSLQADLKRGSGTPSVPYMTWTPVKRWAETPLSIVDLKNIVDTQWLPSCMEHPLVLREKEAHFPNSSLRPCFMGLP